MPISTIDVKSVEVDDDLTDLSWLIEMNNTKQQHSRTNEYDSENKNKKSDRINKPLAIVNGQTIRSSIPTVLYDHQRNKNENQFYSNRQSCNNQAIKRKYESSLSYHHHQSKRFHSEQMLPVYPTSNESFYFDQLSTTQQRTSLPTVSRCMLLKNDPSLSDTLPNVHMSTNFNEPIKMIEHENMYSDDIEHLLDIFKNEVEMIGFDPIVTASTSDCILDLGHCLSSDDFCSY